MRQALLDADLSRFSIDNLELDLFFFLYRLYAV